MSKVQTPSPHASKKHDKRCDSCQAYVSELDPHPVCLKCVPREYSKELPCSHCASLSPDAWKKWERQQASRRSSSSTKGPKGDSAKGGSKSGKATAPPGHCPDAPSTSKAESPGRSRLAALESGFSSFRAEMASMFASLQGRLTASHPPGPKADESRHCDGGARGGEIFPEVPLASQQPCRGLLGPEALPLVGGAPGCDSSDPSHVMEPRGPANHTANHTGYPHGRRNGVGPLGSPAMPDSRSISLPGISLLSGAQPSLSGVRPPPGFTGTPMGSGEFSGSGQTPAVRQAPPLHFGGTRPLPNRTTATITSVTAPAVTMASDGGVSTSTSLG